VSKSVSDTLLKYRCVWDGVEPIVTETAILEESPKDGTAFESKKTLIPDSGIYNNYYYLIINIFYSGNV